MDNIKFFILYYLFILFYLYQYKFFITLLKRTLLILSNKNNVNTVLNARAEKIKHGFSPEEQKAFHTLNYGGHFLQPKHEYEGAGLQQRRVGLIESNIPTASQLAGSAIGSIAGAPGTAVGAVVGRKVGEKTQEKMASKKEFKEAKKLEQQMKQNVKLSEIGK